MSAEPLNCGSGGGDDSYLNLRVAAIFVILIGSSSGALFPILAKRSSWLHVPKSVFECVSLSSHELCLMLP
jgi:zinc transporter 1/2/3